MSLTALGLDRHKLSYTNMFAKHNPLLHNTVQWITNCTSYLNVVNNFRKIKMDEHAKNELFFSSTVDFIERDRQENFGTSAVSIDFCFDVEGRGTYNDGTGILKD